MLRTYVHRSGLRLSWTHVAERMPNRSKAAVMRRWKQIASEQQQSEHALQVHGEQKPWDGEQEDQVRPRSIDVLGRVAHGAARSCER